MNVKKHYSSIVPNNKTNYSSIETIEQVSQNKDILKSEQADNIVASVKDLIDDPAYKPFFFKKLYSIGPSKFMVIADTARRGKFPGRLFVSLLNRA